MSDPHSDEFPPINTTEIQLSARAIITGALLGSVLAMANIYTGLKIGWGFNMSITAALIAFGFWSLMLAIGATKRRFTMLENNVNQVGASAGAAISSAGLVSAVPALTMLDRHDWNFWELSIWVLCCAVLGVFVAVLFRRQMILRDKLPYATGIATAETLKEMYARGAEAMDKVKALILGAAVATAWKITVVVAKIKALPFPGPNVPLASDGAAAKVGAASFGKLGFALDPSLLMVAGGSIIGLRVTAWMFFGAILAWVVIGGYVLDQGWVVANTSADLMKVGPWLLWPGVALLVTASLSSLLFLAPQFYKSLRKTKVGVGDRVVTTTEHDVSTRWVMTGMAIVTVAIVITGYLFFGMSPLIALAAVAMTFVLAIVALRVTGETNVTPVGPMGKVTQLAFGVLDPGNVSTNLMAANVTGGSASQAGEMMHDLKASMLLGAQPKPVIISQLVSVVAAAFAGSGIYLLLMQSIGDKLLTPEWAAPAVAQWKAVAEVFRDGFDKMPKGALDAMLWAGIAGVILTVLEKGVPRRFKAWTPSSSAIGIAFIISAATSFSFFLGGVIGYLLGRFAKSWYLRFGIVIAAGIIAGESLTGMVQTIVEALTASPVAKH